MASTKERFLACSASVGAFLGAAAALVPASCGGTVVSGMGTSSGGAGGAGGTGTGNTGVGNSGTGDSGTGNAGTGNSGTGGTGGMVADGGMMIQDAASELDGTLVDLDGQADSPHLSPDGGDGGDADMS